jgi:tripartite-type tricarboxylate transporter receptor subunit TctC
MRRILSSLLGCALGLVATAATGQDYAWKPDRPVTIIVPWAAGGSTDQMARIVASELEAELKQKFIVVNQPGASGSIGTKNAIEAPKDGYTWRARRRMSAPIACWACSIPASRTGTCSSRSPT